MKHLTILFIALLFSVCGVANSETYIGGSMGASNLDYDVEGAIWREMSTDENVSRFSGAIQALGGGIDVTTDTNSQYSKYFIGYKFNKNFAIELFYLNNLKYTASIETGFAFDTSSAQQNNLIHSSVSVDGNISAVARAQMKLSGVGLRFNGMLPITKNLDFLAGFGVVKFNADIITNVNVNGNYGYDVSLGLNDHNIIGDLVEVGDATAPGRRFLSNKQRINESTGISPMFAMGLLYKVTNSFDIRSEVEVYGLPVNGLSITTISIGGQYRF